MLLQFEIIFRTSTNTHEPKRPCSASPKINAEEVVSIYDRRRKPERHLQGQPKTRTPSPVQSSPVQSTVTWRLSQNTHLAETRKLQARICSLPFSRNGFTGSLVKEKGRKEYGPIPRPNCLCSPLEPMLFPANMLCCHRAARPALRFQSALKIALDRDNRKNKEEFRGAERGKKSHA